MRRPPRKAVDARALSCAYAPGFAEALEVVVRLGRMARSAYAREVAREGIAHLAAKPEMCDKFLSLDSREPFVSNGDPLDAERALSELGGERVG